MAIEYSHTVLEALEQCPRSGYQALTQPRREKAGPSRQGQAGHKVAMLYVQHLIDEKLPSDITIGLDIAEKVLSRLSADDRKGIESDLLRFIEQDFPWAPEAEDAYLETRLFADVDGMPVPGEGVAHIDVPIFGFTPDVWSRMPDGRVVIRDYKFGRVPAQVKSPHENDQLWRYAAALALVLEVSVVEVIVHHGRYQYEECTTLYDEELRDFWVRRVKDPILHWERQRRVGFTFPPVLGPYCRDCDWRWSCPAWLAMPPGPELGDDASGTMTFAALHRARAEELEHALKLWIDEHGTVETDGFEAVLRPETWIRFDTPKLREALSEFLTDEQLEVAFTASKTSVDKAMRQAGMKPKDRREKLDELVELCGSRSVKSKLRIRRKHHPRPEEEGGDDT